MNLFTSIIAILFCSLAFSACERNHTQNENSNGITDEISEHSIFNLPSTWNTQDSQQVVLQDLKGKVTVLVMIYTSCRVTCPKLVADMKNIAAKIPGKHLPNVQFVLVSIDPVADTPSRLKTFASINQMDADHWIFLQGTEYTTRELANVLSVKYEEISPIDFSHSNIISVFNPQGELVLQQEGVGLDHADTIEKIISQLKEM